MHSRFLGIRKLKILGSGGGLMIFFMRELELK